MQLTRWQIRFDPEDLGRAQRWYDPDAADNTPADWRDTAVPAAWNEALGDDTTDVAWYRITLPLQHEPGVRDWLRFGAVCTQLHAWCDGQPIGEHTGNWEPFDLELPPPSNPNAPRYIVLRVDRLRPAPASKIGERVIEHGHITKGFHDILSRQPAGLWQTVELRRTREHALGPLGMTVLADLTTGRVELDLQSPTDRAGCTAVVQVLCPKGNAIAGDAVVLKGGEAALHLTIDGPEPWSPNAPTLYTAQCRLIDADGQESDRITRRFGFRTIETAGRRIRLNGQPIHLSAMLDWGHEPMQTAPAPSSAELRRRFRALKAMGINCVCVCLWYPPQNYYDIADEMGMLLWQEHPIWKPAMDDSNRETFKQHFERFFRMDRSHPSVVIVSGSCEHDAMDPQLAQWWWDRANQLMPDRLLQVQTAFLRLVPPEQTHLYDEHTYENSGRWPEFLDDMDATLAPLTPKPFVMGESILYNDWPDVPSLHTALGSDRPWWVCRVLDHATHIEQQIAQRYSNTTLQRFRQNARDWHLNGRKWQTEVFRQNPDHAGLVQNGLRDVAQCPLGFMDDLDHWKLTPAQTRPWLAPNALLLRTPNHMRSFSMGETLQLELGAAAFGETPIGSTIDLNIDASTVGWHHQATLAIDAEPGQVAWVPYSIDLPVSDTPIELNITARAAGTPGNRWRIWLLPEAGTPAHRIASLATQREPEPLGFEEASYSSGWGLGVKSWRRVPPDAATLLSHTTPLDADAPQESFLKARVLAAHALSPAVLDWVERGGRLLLLPDGSPGSLPTIIPTLWGQSPLILDHGPLTGVDPTLILDTLDRDLHHRWVRTVPTAQLGIEDDVTPCIRLIHTHDSVGKINITDDLFAFRMGQGLVLVSALDHTTAAGGWLLHRMIAWLADDPQGVAGELTRSRLESLRLTPKTPAATPA
ncbi:MAG: hypothetical protein ACIAXF_09040 [Phycisphaerales bacterium JB063]